MLQDCVELVVLAALDELDIDEQRSLESKSFDELLSELKKHGAPIIKSGTIKALNKQRVISKHYGQLAEPASVVNYLDVADQFINSLLRHIAGKPLAEIFLINLVNECAAKAHLNQAVLFAESNEYLRALIEIRKAFYSSYENEYSIYGWRNTSRDKEQGFSFAAYFFGGRKSYHWMKNSEWIGANVRTPTEYVQINHEQLKIDCMEWGLSTIEIENLRRLTPDVVETEKGVWHIEYDFNFPANEANQSNFNYCLEVIINFLLKKQEHDSNRKWPKKEQFFPMPPVYIGKSIHQKPLQTSPVIHIVQEGYLYSIEKIISGFNHGERYQYIHLHQLDEETNESSNHIWGYLLIEDSPHS